MKKATLMLADHAVVENGKLYINGGGWTIAGSFCPHAVAMLLEVPWDEANETQRFSLDLLDSDDNPFAAPSPEGPVTVQFGGNFETGRPPGTRPGTPVTWAASFTIGPLPLEAGARYVWRLTWNDEADDAWRLPFNTRPSAPPGGVQQVA